jgi:hypothetical protein
MDGAGSSRGFSVDNDQLPGSEPLENLFELEGDILHPNAETLTAANDPIYYKYDSDASTPSDLSTSNGSNLRIKLLHKQRGGKGAWSEIQNDELIRVTKGIGKRIKLELNCNEEFDWSGVKIDLFDLAGNVSCSDDEFTLDNHLLKSDGAGYGAEVELKLYNLAKCIEFRVTVTSLTGAVYAGHSISFSTHDSGKQRKKSPRVHAAQPISAPVANVEMEYEMSSPDSDQQPDSASHSFSSASGASPLMHPQPLSASPSFSNSSPLSSSPNPLLEVKEEHIEYTAPAEKKRKLDQLQESAETGFDHVVPGSLDVQGVVRAKGYLQYSDIRLKTNTEDIMDALDIVTKLQGKRYQWKDELVQNEVGGRKVIGLIAQEVRRVLPEVVHEDRNGYLSVNYADLVPILVEGLKQHLKNYESDKSEMKEQISELRSNIEVLKHKSDSETRKMSHELGVLRVKMEKFELSSSEEEHYAAREAISNNNIAGLFSRQSSYRRANPAPTAASHALEDEDRERQRRLRGLGDNPRGTARRQGVTGPRKGSTVYVPGYTSELCREDLLRVKRVCLVALNGWPLLAVNDRQSVLEVDDGTYPARNWKEREVQLYVEQAERAVREMCPALEHIYAHPLASEGTVTQRLENYTVRIQADPVLKNNLQDADLVWFIAHSQAVPLAVILANHLITHGIVSKPTERRQSVSILSMAGLWHNSSRELLMVQQMCSTAPHKHLLNTAPFALSDEHELMLAALQNILGYGVTVTCLAGYGDHVIDLYDAAVDNLQHSHVLRGLYVDKMHRSQFEPNINWKKPTNFIEEMILFALLLKNLHEDADLLRFVAPSGPEVIHSMPKNFFKYISHHKLRQVLFGHDGLAALTNFSTFFVYMGSPLSLMSPWGYKFYRACVQWRQAFEVHRAITACPEVYRVGLEWALTRHSHSPAPLLQRTVLDTDTRTLLQQLRVFEQQVRRVHSQYEEAFTTAYSAFKYWKPSNSREEAIQKALKNDLNWNVNDRLLAEFVDQFVEKIAREAEKQVENLKQLEKKAEKLIKAKKIKDQTKELAAEK